MARATPTDDEQHDSPGADMRLGPVSYVVLGIVDRLGPASSYDLKQKVEHSVGYFWPFPHTQLYSEPQRLVGLGLLEQHAEEGGRRRRTYSITRAGRDALEAWLAEPVAQQTVIRDTGLLQLFFASTCDADDAGVAERATRIAEAQIAAHRERLAAYEALAASFGAQGDGDGAGAVDPMCSCHARTLQLGFQLEQLLIEFWSDVQRTPPTAG